MNNFYAVGESTKPTILKFIDIFRWKSIEINFKIVDLFLHRYYSMLILRLVYPNIIEQMLYNLDHFVLVRETFIIFKAEYKSK